MLALIAGTGGLPQILLDRLTPRPLVCALTGFVPDIAVDVVFRIEHLGSFLADLSARGVDAVCFAGAVRRPVIDQGLIDAATAPLVPRIAAAMAAGDDAALRIVMALFEEQGLRVQSASDIAPDLVPPTGVLTRVGPLTLHRIDARAGEGCVARMGAADTGQACVICDAEVIATEGLAGTDAMLAGLVATPQTDPFSGLMGIAEAAIGGAADWLSGGARGTPRAGIVFKAPKPGQDMRADMPLIGPETVAAAEAAGLAGIVIEAGGVMVLDLPRVIAALDAQGMFLWVRPRGAA